MLSIGELSRRTGVKIPTIRYYEQMGLISAPERSDGNQRRYSTDGLSREQALPDGRIAWEQNNHSPDSARGTVN